jgi:preprotein translocase subunit SecE
MAFMQYLKDTRSELNHVSWPTRTQTAVFTTLVIVISVIVSLYLGVFDYLFTRAMGKAIEFVPAQEEVVELPDITDTIAPTTTDLKIPGFEEVPQE